MNNTLKYLFAMAMAAAGTSAYAASGVIELEIPGMNEETAARIVDFRTNACPATVAALRDSIASNYDGVVLRKADKRGELQAEADALAVELEAMIATNAVQYAIRRQPVQRDNLYRRGRSARRRLEYADLPIPYLQGLRQGRSFRLNLAQNQGRC